jgi:hypothetical protein
VANWPDRPKGPTGDGKGRPTLSSGTAFSRWQRVGLVSLGISLVIAGATSVFLSENGLGSAGLPLESWRVSDSWLKFLMGRHGGAIGVDAAAVDAI